MPKRSPKHERACDALVELSKIAELLDNENLSVILVFLKAEEYRISDGLDKTRHKGATKIDKIPTELVDMITLKSKKELLTLLPPELPEKFTAKEFYKTLNRRGRGAWRTLKIMTEIGLLEIIGKKGKAYIYTKKRKK